MLKRFPCAIALATVFLASPGVADETTSGSDEITEITVNARRVANTRPAGTYATPATTLRFDPLTELQSRGLAEGQSDVAVRGGIFESTGFELGAVTVMDPQTGHYTGEIPIDPALVTAPAIYLGIDNAIAGFNSTIATLAYAYRPIAAGGYVALGAGDNALRYQAFRLARTGRSANGSELGAALTGAYSQGDGTVPNGDFHFARFNLQLQRITGVSQSDFLVAYQDKFYGWPGAYTGFAVLPETDATQTTVIAANHRRESGSGWWELGAYFRQLSDDYDFDRNTIESGGPGSFDHETRVSAVGLQGLRDSGSIRWRYGGQLTADELVRSTDLTNGFFDSRNYVKLVVVPELDIPIEDGRLIRLRAGASWDYSNRDGGRVLPLAGVALVRSTAVGQTEISLEYSGTSQLPGYTALNSNPTGLFGGNPYLGRETSSQVLLSLTHDASEWQGRLAVFSRSDDDLVDWTYAENTPNLRQANPVEVDVFGVEALLTRQWNALDIAAGYVYLDKDENYGAATVDASYYVLNFARHRATLAMRYRFARRFEFRWDNEYREQEPNPLRVGDSSTYLASVSLAWLPQGRQGLGAAFLVDNATDSKYQPFPGTPASGRQYSLSVSYSW